MKTVNGIKHEKVYVSFDEKYVYAIYAQGIMFIKKYIRCDRVDEASRKISDVKDGIVIDKFGNYFLRSIENDTENSYAFKYIEITKSE